MRGDFGGSRKTAKPICEIPTEEYGSPTVDVLNRYLARFRASLNQEELHPHTEAEYDNRATETVYRMCGYCGGFGQSAVDGGEFELGGERECDRKLGD